MRVTNNVDKKEVTIRANYSEIHYIGQSLSSHQLFMQRIYGVNSEEEKYLGELLHVVRNPVVKKESI